MHIALITEDWPPRLGGIATWSVEVARALAHLGVRVTVLARGPEDALPEAPFDAPYTLVPFGGTDWVTFRVWHVWWAVRRFLRDAAADDEVGLIAVNWHVGRGVAAYAGRVQGRLAIVAHGQEVQRVVGGRSPWLMRRAFRRSRAAVAVSRYTADLLTAQGVDPGRVRVVFGGADADRFHPAPPDPDLRTRLGLGAGPVVLTLSRLAARKGQDTLIRAWPRVMAAHPGAVLLVAGEGPEEAALKALAEQLGVSGAVRFSGPAEAEEVPDLYRQADLYAMISRERAEVGDVEGFGLTYLEAGATGLPVIGGRSGGVVDAIEEGRSGLLVEPGDPDAAAEAILRLLDRPEEASAMGGEGRARVLESFTWEHTARGLLDALGMSPGAGR